MSLNRIQKAVILGVAAFLVISASAQSLHTWSSGQVVAADDLNGNFTALKNAKVGSGVTLTNTDVATGAAISHAKLATPALVPKAWAVVTAACTGSAAAGTACTQADSSQLTITTNGVSGEFRGTLSYTPANTAFGVTIGEVTAQAKCLVNARSTSAPHFLIRCFDYTAAAGTALDANEFTVVVLDS